MRTGMLAKQLCERGHSVDWWTTAFDHQYKKFLVNRYEVNDIANNYRLHFLYTRVSYRKNISPFRLVNHWRVAADFRKRAALVLPPDIIVCSYPTIDMATAAIQFGEARGIPVILDVRDLWPDIFSDAFPGVLRLLRLDSALLRPLRRRKDWVFRHATALTAISARYLQWAIDSKETSDEAKTAVFPLAYSKVDGIRLYKLEALEIRRQMGFQDTDVVVWFAGTFGRTYDLMPALTAAKRMQVAGRNVRFVFSGDGEMRDEWEGVAADLNNVVFTGWVQGESLMRIAAIADIGLLAYRKGAPQGLPNKIFEYLALGVPVLSSLEGECRDLIETAGVGMFYAADITDDLELKLDVLLSDQHRRWAMGVAAKKLYSEKYDADIVYRRFAEYIENLVTSA